MARVLIIEDETSIRKVLTEIITEQKELAATVDAAKNGDEGLQLMEANHYDVVLCDIRMPGTDGMEVLRKAK
ncbi:MAG: response regulator transcription factor, partial [Bacteroidota bacterium]